MIRISQAPTYEGEDEEIASKIPFIPFAIFGSDKIVTAPDGHKVRGCAHPGVLLRSTTRTQHCNFVKLRQLLLRTYMEELREYTNNILYENWRTEKLLGTGVVQDPIVFKEVNPAVRNHKERVMHEAKLPEVEAETKTVFQQKVAEKESKLKQSEEELHARHKEVKEALNKQKGDLEEKRRRIERGRPLTPEGKSSVGLLSLPFDHWLTNRSRLEERRASSAPNPPSLQCIISYVFSLSAPTPSPSLVSSDAISPSLSALPSLFYTAPLRVSFQWGVADVVDGSLSFPILAYPDVTRTHFDTSCND